MLRRIAWLKASAGGGSLFSYLAAELQKVRHAVPGAEPVREEKASRERMGGCNYRCATPLPAITGSPARSCGCGCTHPLLWTAFARKRIDRPVASHAPFADHPVAHCGRGTSKGGTGKNGGFAGVGERGIHGSACGRRIERGDRRRTVHCAALQGLRDVRKKHP